LNQNRKQEDLRRRKRNKNNNISEIELETNLFAKYKNYGKLETDNKI